MEVPASDNFFQSGFRRSEKQRLSSIDHQYHHHQVKHESFVIEEFLDLSNDEDQNNVIIINNNDDVKLPSSSPVFNNACRYNNGLNSTESSSVTVVDSNCNSEPNHLLCEIGQRSLVDGNFAGELCVPYEDIAELEWLSTITEESFSSEDMQKLQLISGMTPRLNESSRINEFNKSDTSSSLRNEMLVPGKARSKRSRTAPGNWASRLLVLSPTSSTSETHHPVPTMSGKSIKTTMMKKKEKVEISSPSEGRRCLHCATDKTPQWRTGPLGPKTLCNACGVRYKSGRLVPEYRPAASPTFVQTKHSNSHRKVLELRRQKEMHRPHPNPNPHHLHPHNSYQIHPHHVLQHHQNMMFDHVSNGEDYLIHQHMGPGYQLI